MGAIMYYLWHGKAPDNLRDYYEVPDARGTRWWLPSYMKDIISVGNEGPLKVAKSKIHPALTQTYEMLGNRDWSDRPIRNADDPIVKQFGQVGDYLRQENMPMAFKSPQVNQRHGLTPLTTQDQVLPKIGITHVPQSIANPGKFPIVHPANEKSRYGLPHFAEGGRVDEPTKAVVGEAGPEKIVDVKDPASMAKSGEDIIRGSSNIPLSQEGQQQAEQLAQRFKAKGFHGEIHVSDLLRARQTAAPIAAATESPIVSETSGLHPWHLGQIEGQPTKQVLGDMNRYMLKKPNVPVPGRGPHSSQDGEAFNSFKRRLLNFVIPQVDSLKQDPEKQILDVTHYRDLRLIEAWIRRGAPKSMEIDIPHMVGKGDAPGSVSRVFWSGNKPKIEKVNMKSDTPLPGGLYFARHGITLWNGESKQAGGKIVDKPTVMTLAKNGPQEVIPLGKPA
jgi:broad specificity phosphatase PhoE